MNNRKIKMYSSLYEYLLILQEPLKEFLMIFLNITACNRSKDNTTTTAQTP